MSKDYCSNFSVEYMGMAFKEASQQHAKLWMRDQRSREKAS